MKTTNPFLLNKRIDITFVSFNLSDILRNTGFSLRDCQFHHDKDKDGKEVLECDFDPWFLDKDGNKTYFQRGLVWNDDDKRSLIDSIYHGINIGAFVIGRRSYEAGVRHGSFHDIIDGKQRLNAIIEFGQGKFADSYGNYWNDLDDLAQRTFWNYNKQTLAIVEDPSPELIKRIFLTVNYTGKPMSKEHIEFVKSINI